MAFSSTTAAAAKRAMLVLLLTAVFVVVLSDSSKGSKFTASRRLADPRRPRGVPHVHRGLNLTLPNDLPPALFNFTGSQANLTDFVVDLFLGVGQQEYTYNGTAWVNTNVSANLYNSNVKRVAHHFFIPAPGVGGATATWERVDVSSRVTALALVKIPQPTAVPLLLLEAKFNTGSGASPVFGQVTHVQRLETHNGLPPSTPGSCAGETFNSEYSALYAFYRSIK